LRVGERQRDVVGRDMRARDCSIQNAAHDAFCARNRSRIAGHEEPVAIGADGDIE